MKEKKDALKCLFCEAGAATADQENLIVHRGTHSFVMLNRYPYTSGHLMIAPYQHAARLNAVSEEVTEELIRIARRAEHVLEDSYHPNGLNLGMNFGEAAGAGIAHHIHMHVLPRWSGDANFMTTVADTRVIPEALEVTYKKLKSGFATL